MSVLYVVDQGFPGGASGKASTCQCSGHGFDPLSRKIPRATEQLNPCATATKPELQSLCSTAREATAMRNPSTPTRESPCVAKKTRHSQKQMSKEIKLKKRTNANGTLISIGPINNEQLSEQ